MSDTNRINLNKLFLCSLGILTLGLVLSTKYVVAEEYVSLALDPQKLGVFYQNKTAQFHAIATTASGAEVDITDEVDWYIDPAGYPINNEQDESDGAVATIDPDTGLVTLADGATWGRVVVYACYPKGCGPNSSNGIVSVIKPLLLIPSHIVKSSVIGNGTVTPSGDNLFKEGRVAEFTLAPDLPGNKILLGDIDDQCGDSNLATLSYDGSTYRTDSIVGPCNVEFEFTSANIYTVGYTANNGTAIPELEGADPNEFTEGQQVVFNLTADTGHQILPAGISDDCGATDTGVLSSDGLKYTTEKLDGDCDVQFNFQPTPYTVTSSATNGTVTPNGPSMVSYGQQKEFTLAADTGYEILPEDITDDCGASGAGVLSGDKSTYTTEAIDGSCSVDFEFSFIPATLTVDTATTGIGTVGGVLSTPGGIACDSAGMTTDCTEIYTEPTSVTLSALAVSGNFVEWTEGVEGCTPISPDTLNDSEIEILMNSDQTCIANFGN